MRTTTCAPRFSLTLPVRYRVAGEAGWQPAKTRNLSTSGVLFRVRDAMRIGTAVELEIELDETYPAHATRAKAAGEVVRQLKDESGQQDGWFVAVKFREYRLERKQEPQFPAPLPKRLPFAPAPAR